MNAYILKEMLSLSEGNHFDTADAHASEKKSMVLSVFYIFLPTNDFLSRPPPFLGYQFPHCSCS